MASTPFPSEPLVDALLRAKAQAIRENRNLNKAEMITILDNVLAELWKQLPAHKRKKTLPGGNVVTDEWLQSLRDDPANKGIDIDQELAKCRMWTLNRAGAKLTRMRFVNWLLKADRPLPMHSPGRAGENIRKLDEPTGWKEFLNSAYPESTYSQGGHCEAFTWAGLPREVQEKIIRENPPKPKYTILREEP